MRLKFLATLALAPALLHAQAPTQQNAGVLQARVESPAVLSSSTDALPNNTAAKAVRVSTGVQEPVIVKTVPVNLSGLNLDFSHPADNKVVLSIALDEKGTVQSLTVAKSANKALDARVVEAVRQYHFRPATLDSDAIAVQLELAVLVQQ